MDESETVAQPSKEQAENVQGSEVEQPNVLSKDTPIQKTDRIVNWINTQQPGTPSSLDSNSTFTYENRSGSRLKTKEKLPVVPCQKEPSSLSICTEESIVKETSKLSVKPIEMLETSSFSNSTFICEKKSGKPLKTKGKLLALPHQKELTSISSCTEENALEEASQSPVKPIVRSASLFSNSTFTCEKPSENHLETKQKLPATLPQKEPSSVSTCAQGNTAEEASQPPVTAVVGPESSFKAEPASSRQTKEETAPRTLRSGAISSIRSQRGSSETTDSVKSRKRKTSSNAVAATGSKMRRVSDVSDSEPSFKLQLSSLSLTKRQNSAKSSKSKESNREEKKKPITVESLLVNKTILPNLVETLQEQANGLIDKKLTRNYARKLNDCMVRVLRSHGKLTGTEPTTERVKRTTRK